MSVLDPATRRHLDKQVDDLAQEFSGVFSRETVERFVGESLDGLRSARFADFVPVLVHRFARERLRALGQAEGSIAKDVPEVLFVCVQNAGRAQMAAGLMSHRSEGRVHVRSAGCDPAEAINPAVVEAMAEVGVDLYEEFPKPLTDEVVRAADAVVTMGCGDACPVYPGKRYLDWDLPIPRGRTIAHGARDPGRDRCPRPGASRRAGPGRRRPIHRLALSMPLAPRLAAEAFGTFTLVFAGAGAIMVDAKTGGLGGVGVALAFGLAIMTMVYALGHVSGAHFNPAVSLAFALTRRFPWSRVAAYWVAQVTGALAAAFLLRASLGDVADVGATEPSGSDGQAFLWEVVLTFVLMLVIAAVATDSVRSGSRPQSRSGERLRWARSSAGRSAAPR